MSIWPSIKEVSLEPFTSVPAELQIVTGRSVWGGLHRNDPTPRSFLEGPVLDGEGGLYMVDVAWGRILHADKTGDMRVVFQYDGEPNGLGWSGDELLIADYKNGLMALAGLSDADVRLTHKALRYGQERFKGLNDLCVADDGRVFFTDQGATGLHDPTGRLFCLHEDGRLEMIMDCIPSPNGLVFDERGNQLLVAATRDNSIWRIPLGRHGVQKAGRFIQLSGGVGPDGLAWGPNGTLLVCHLGLGRVWVFDRLGLPVLVLKSPAGFATTNAIVDDAGRVFVTESETGTILTADLDDALQEVLQ